MTRLSFGEVSSAASPALDIQISDTGNVPADPATLAFVVQDLSSGAPLQVFPATGRQAITIADVPTGQRLSTGRFFAPWTAPTSGAGTYRILWWFTETVGGPEIGPITEDFEVFDPAPTALSANFYTTLAAFRDMGIAATDVDDARLNATLVLVHQLVEQYTRQWFNPRTVEFRLDGNNTSTLFLPVPIVSIEFLRINESTVDLPLTSYHVYAGRARPADDRRNPRIVLDRGQSGNIFRAPFSASHPSFLKGRQNQHVRGVFGFLEPDDSTPAPIVEAVERMVVERLSNPAFGAVPITGNTILGGTIVMEKTDGHEYRISSDTSLRPAGLDGITSDPFVRDVLRMYRGPKGIGSTSSFRV